MNDDSAKNFADAESDGLADLLAEGLTGESATVRDDSSGLPGQLDSGDARAQRGSPPLFPPAQIPGYQIVREIGRGGMGRVYQAVQLSTRRTVALKVMLEGLFSSKRARRRFEREVRIIATLRHPHIAQVYESGLHEGRYWFAMEFVDGRPLGLAAKAARLTFEQRVSVVASVCEAVGYAHERGVIHRDLKPGNILVSADGQPHLVDFGLARIADPQRSHEITLSAPGELMGTPAYMSPEQAAREPTKVGTQTDVYSLGVILYRLLTGQHPYNVRGRLDEVVREIATTEPTPPCQVNPEMDGETEAVLLKALAKDPTQRYSSAKSMAADLRRRLAGEPVEAKLRSRTYRLTKKLARHRKALLASAAVAATAVASALLTWGWLGSGADRAVSGLVAVETLADPKGAQESAATTLPGPVGSEEKAPMPKPGAGFATAWLDGKLHVIGGESEPHGYRPDHFVYDPVRDSWAVAAPMLTRRTHCGAAVSGGKLYAIGGRTARGPEFTAAVESYDPASDTWAPCESLPEARADNAAVASVADRVYVLGGHKFDGQKTVQVRETCIYDPARDHWSHGAPFPALPGNPTAGPLGPAAIRGTEIYVMAGVSTWAASGFSLCSYDTLSDHWSQHSPRRREWGMGLEAAPRLLAIEESIALLTDREIEGRVLFCLYSPVADIWRKVDASRISYDGWALVELAEYGSGYYVLGGGKRHGKQCDYTARTQYISCDRPLAALAELVQTAPAWILLEHAFTGDGPLGPPWQTEGGSWQIEQDTLVVRYDEPYETARAVYAARDWTDYALECDLLHESAELAFLFRLDATRGVFYRLVLKHEERRREEDGGACEDEGAASFARCFFDPQSDPLGIYASTTKRFLRADYISPRDEYRSLRIEVEGLSMRAYIDGQCILTAEDDLPDPPLSGGIGFGAATACYQPCKAAIRNLRVVKLER